MNVIHFKNETGTVCGSKERHQRFTVMAEKATCPVCRALAGLERADIPVGLAEIMDGWDDKDVQGAYAAWKQHSGADDDTEGFETFLEREYTAALPWDMKGPELSDLLYREVASSDAFSAIEGASRLSPTEFVVYPFKGKPFKVAVTECEA